MASTETETWQTVRACTDLKLKKLRYHWTICNFSFCPQDNGKAMDSPIYGPKEGPQWQLTLFPRGDREASKNHISLYLTPYFVSSLKEKTRWNFKFRFILLNSRQEPIFEESASDESDLWNLDTFENGRGYDQLMSRDELIGLIKDDELNICCELIIFDGYKTNTFCQLDDASISPVPECTLSNDLESTFKEHKFGDTIIEVADKEFLVYRGILQTRSPVFAAMFQYELQEKKENRVVIPDAKPNVIEEMLTYIYTGRSPNIETMAHDLLPIAEKYNLERWKTMSENVISGNLTRENAVETLILADLYRANQLKKKVIHFIIAESFYFLEDAAWENLRSSLSKMPDLLIELTKALFRSKK